MKVFLVGFTSAGKTTFGKQLAKMLNYKFIDLDEAIHKKYGKSIQELFKQHGETLAREYESITLKEVIRDNDNFVLATGGGAPCFHDNMELMIKNGITVYLKGTPEFLFSRLKKSAADRPLIQTRSDDQLMAFIKNNLEKRSKYYEMAHYHLNAIDPNPRDIGEIW